MYINIEEKARKMAEKAKPSVVNIGGKVYTFEFCQREWVYKVYEDGFFLVHFNCKTLATAKRYLKEWLQN